MLTSQDLKLIEDLFIKFEEKLSNKIDERADQIIEYVNINTEAHEKWLQDHEVRIHNLEGNGYQVNDRKKLK